MKKMFNLLNKKAVTVNNVKVPSNKGTLWGADVTAKTANL